MYSENKARRALDQWKRFTNLANKRDAKFKSVLNQLKSTNLRSYFAKWKQMADQDRAWQENEEEDGLTNLEAWQLRQENLNLIKMLREDGISRLEIARMHKDADDKYKRLVEKVLCRILCQNGDLKLLPTCLEQWKKYARIRKVWKRVLRDASNRLDRNQEIGSMIWAFRRLKYAQTDRENALLATPLPKLKQMCVKNVEKLDYLADKIDRTYEGKEDLTKQRDLLLKHQIAG